MSNKLVIFIFIKTNKSRCGNSTETHHRTLMGTSQQVIALSSNTQVFLINTQIDTIKSKVDQSWISCSSSIITYHSYLSHAPFQYDLKFLHHSIACTTIFDSNSRNMVSQHSHFLRKSSTSNQAEPEQVTSKPKLIGIHANSRSVSRHSVCESSSKTS